MAKGRINTKDLVQKIEKITKDRIVKEGVVNLDEYRELKQKKQTPKSILVIEDDETMRKALKRILEAEGYRAITAADGTQLSTVLDDSPIDLIILDIGLPWINGLELAKLLKEHDDLKSIPLIFVSGKTGDLDVKRGFDAGADDYIKKPFDIEKIKKTVATLLKLSK
ncbi:MAG: response regulator [Bdellovibrionaceae bacterium]|nr:response regulator [Pseudobdellovibrionaceae bacterium]